MKKLLSAILVLTLCFSLTACGGGKSSPEAPVENFIESFKEQDYNKLTETVIMDGEVSSDKIELPEGQKRLYKELYKDFNYKIVKSEERGENNAFIRVEVKKPNVAFLPMSYMNKCNEEGFGFGYDISYMSKEERYDKALDILKACIKESDSFIETRNINIDVVKDSEGNWKIKDPMGLFELCYEPIGAFDVQAIDFDYED